MKPSISKNYFYSLLYQVFVMIMPLITIPYISRVLGAEGIGIFGFTTSITTYFILIGSLGIATYGQREIACVQNNKEKYSQVFYELIIVRFVTIIISCIFYYFLLAHSGEYAIYYRLLLFEILAHIFDISWFFQGMENFKKVSLRNIFVKSILLICTFIFVKTKEDVFIYILIYTLSIVLGNLCLWLNIKKYIVKPKEFNFKRHIKPMLLMFIPQIAIQVYTVLDKSMLGWLTNDVRNVGYYEQAQKIVKLSLTIITTYGTVMLPRNANDYYLGNDKKIFENLNNSFRFVWFLGLPIMFGLILISPKFVPIFYGNDFNIVKYLIYIFSPMVLIIGFANVIGVQYLISIKKQNHYTFAVITSAIVNVVLNFVLIPKLNVIGASISSVIAELAGLIIQIYFVRKLFDFKKIIMMSKNYIFATIVMLIFGILVSLLNIPNIIILSVQLIFGILIYFIVLIILKDQNMRKIIKKIKRGE